MPSANITGDYTIQQVLFFTQERFKNRFDYKRRDFVKMIRVRKIKYFSKVRPDLPLVRYEVVSRSMPNYGNYLKNYKTGKRKRYQRSIKHHYDVRFTFGNEGMTLSTRKWSTAVGSMSKWVKAPQNSVKTIRRETLAKWKKQAEKKFDKKKDQQAWLKEEKEKHRKKAQFVDDGDYNASFGRNGDWLFRDAFAFYHHGHLDGRNYNGNIPSHKTNPDFIPFFTKHQIAVIETMLNEGILKR